jgi:hypothetical protein
VRTPEASAHASRLPSQPPRSLEQQHGGQRRRLRHQAALPCDKETRIMSFNYDRYDRRQNNSGRRNTLGYWVPLTLTVVVATAGLAAWVWSAREDHEDVSSDDDLSYGEDSSREKAHGKASGGPGGSRDAMTTGVVREDEQDILSRAQGIIRRTPSPQQLFDTVSKKTAAGWAAAGAALASIREEDKDDYGDHNRWSEEAAIRRNVEAQSSQSAAAVDTQTRSFAASVKNPPAGGKRRTVVLVVSAESLMDHHDDDSSYRSEDAVSTRVTFVEARLTSTDHPLAPPRHRLQPHQALRPHLLPISSLPPSLAHRHLLSRRLLLGHLDPSTHTRRGAPVHRPPPRRAHRLHAVPLRTQLRQCPLEHTPRPSPAPRREPRHGHAFQPAQRLRAHAATHRPRPGLRRRCPQRHQRQQHRRPKELGPPDHCCSRQRRHRSQRPR